MSFREAGHIIRSRAISIRSRAISILSRAISTLAQPTSSPLPHHNPSDLFKNLEKLGIYTRHTRRLYFKLFARRRGPLPQPWCIQVVVADTTMVCGCPAGSVLLLILVLRNTPTSKGTDVRARLEHAACESGEGGGER